MGDAARFDGEIDPSEAFDRHADPPGDDEGERETVGDDDLAVGGIGEDFVHGAVDAGAGLAAGFGTVDAAGII